MWRNIERSRKSATESVWLCCWHQMQRPAWKLKWKCPSVCVAQYLANRVVSQYYYWYNALIRSVFCGWNDKWLWNVKSYRLKLWRLCHYNLYLYLGVAIQPRKRAARRVKMPQCEKCHAAAMVSGAAWRVGGILQYNGGVSWRVGWWYIHRWYLRYSAGWYQSTMANKPGFNGVMAYNASGGYSSAEIESWSLASLIVMFWLMAINVK